MDIIEYKEKTANYFNALARTAILARISNAAFEDFPNNLPKKLKDALNADFKFLSERKRFRKDGFLTVDDYEHFTKDYDAFTRFSLLLVMSNLFNLDMIFKLNEAKGSMKVIENLLVHEVYRKSYLELHNVPDTHLTVKAFNEKYGALNVLDINFSTPQNAADYYTDVIDYSFQLFSQIITTILAQFESFLANSIQLFLKGIPKDKIVKIKQKGKTRRCVIVTTNGSEEKVVIPNLKFLNFANLTKFIMDPNIKLLEDISDEKKKLLTKYRRIRNLIVHNGGYINDKFIQQYPEYSSQKNKLIKLDNDEIAKLFWFIWRSSLKIYNYFVKMK